MSNGGWRPVTRGGRRSSSPDDDSAVLVDNRSDVDDDVDAVTRTVPLLTRSGPTALRQHAVFL